ncbi:MAG: hypothetical protein ACFCVE_05275 [Phycisphaerae bacterium]
MNRRVQQALGVLLLLAAAGVAFSTAALVAGPSYDTPAGEIIPLRGGNAQARAYRAMMQVPEAFQEIQGGNGVLRMSKNRGRSGWRMELWHRDPPALDPADEALAAEVGKVLSDPAYRQAEGINDEQLQALRRIRPAQMAVSREARQEVQGMFMALLATEESARPPAQARLEARLAELAEQSLDATRQARLQTVREARKILE